MPPRSIQAALSTVWVLVAVLGLAVSPATSQAQSAPDASQAEWHLMAGGSYQPVAWTGQELLLWNGPSQWGVRYTPQTESWVHMASAGAPSSRSEFGAVWTGSELLIWGGIGCQQTWCGDGARYDPKADRWTPLASAGAPAARSRPAVVWTGTEMLVLGGLEAQGLDACDGAAYNPRTDTWRPIATAGAAATCRPLAVWTGKEAIVWGPKKSVLGADGRVVQEAGSTGARYDPALDRWSPMAPSPDAVLPRALRTLTGAIQDFQTVVWSGREALFWGVAVQVTDTPPLRVMTGAAYDPVSDRWRALPTSGAPVPSAGIEGAVWTGSEMLTFVDEVDTSRVTVARYRPQTDAWIPLAAGDSIPYLPYTHPAGVGGWTGREMLVWTGEHGARYDPQTGAWRIIGPPFGAPQPRVEHTMVWTGRDVLIWGGMGGERHQPTLLNDGARYTPATDTWVPLPMSGAPAPRTGHTAVWTGQTMLIWGGAGQQGVLNDGGSYDPTADAWQALPQDGAPRPRSHHTAVWTGSEMIIWGGDDGQQRVGDGARYDPASRTWRPLPLDGAPSPRADHTAVWTGSEMIVWGGSGCGEDGSRACGDGARYDPLSDRWTPLPSDDALIARTHHTAVWTGQTMLISGGASAYGLLDEGVSFDPATNRWTQLDLGGGQRAYGTAVWTGQQMVVWGGEGTYKYDPSLRGGAAYDPVTGTWTYLPTPANDVGTGPLVWDGTELIVWGGYGSSGSLATGGVRLRVPPPAPAPPTSVSTPRCAAPGGLVQINGTVWIVDSVLGEPLTSPPHRQSGIEIDFDANSRTYGVTTTDDDGRWSYQGTLLQIVAGFHRVADPDQPGREVQYVGIADPCFLPGARTLRMDLTVWRRPSDITKGIYATCRPDALSFEGGLLALAYALGDTMGTPLDCLHATSNGDLVQNTSTGLAYENADGWFFTDGDQTWTLEPDGSAEPT